jgi:hypothetical protein
MLKVILFLQTFRKRIYIKINMSQPPTWSLESFGYDIVLNSKPPIKALDAESSPPGMSLFHFVVLPSSARGDNAPSPKVLLEASKSRLNAVLGNPDERKKITSYVRSFEHIRNEYADELSRFEEKYVPDSFRFFVNRGKFNPENPLFHAWNPEFSAQFQDADAYLTSKNLVAAGGNKKSLKKTNERMQLGGKSAVVYEGTRGGKYVKKNGKFISLKQAQKI